MQRIPSLEVASGSKASGDEELPAVLTDVHGRFQLGPEQDPRGQFELRVGTPDELRAGRAQHREKITVRDGMPLVEVVVGG